MSLITANQPSTNIDNSEPQAWEISSSTVAAEPVNTTTMPPSESPSDAASEVEQFVGCVFEPDDIVELRLLPSKRSTWHRASALSTEAEKLALQNAGGENIYVGANPRSRNGGTTNADVAIA